MPVLFVAAISAVARSAGKDATPAMRESEVEKYLCQRIAAIGGLCEKFVSPGRVGVPDRLVTFNGRMYLVELKCGSGRLSKSQMRDHKLRESKGIWTWIAWNKEQVDQFVDWLEVTQ